MFGKHAMRALRAFHGGGGGNNPHLGGRRQPQPPQGSNGLSLQLRGLCTSALGVGVGALPGLQAVARNIGSRTIGGGAALLVGGGTAFALSQNYHIEDGRSLDSDRLPWVQAIASSDGVLEVQSPGQMLRRHPVGKMVVEQDHLFEAMVQAQQLKEFRCFYDTHKRIFYSVVQLGREVCGFPQTVHGGLTAALVDETFGGLAVAVWRDGKLGFRPPAYTARLEVDYKKKLPSNTTILISTEIESIQDRKVWMKATVSDGKGGTYATARALFVAPRFLEDWIQQFKRSSRGRA